jgi:hypothetical protein
VADIPNPYRTLQHLGWVALGKLEEVAAWFERKVRDEYFRPGDRDR